MIVVDINVISELMRGQPHPAVLAWMGAQPRALLYTTHTNQAESSMTLLRYPTADGALR